MKTTIQALLLTVAMLASPVWGAQQTINLGTAPSGTGGDNNRQAFTKVNANFTELYTADTALEAALAGKQASDADLAALAALTGTNTIYYRSGANTWTAVTIGANLTFVGGTLSATGELGGSVAWGAVTGTLSAQTDLQNALNAKAATVHAHAISDTTGLQAALDAKAAAVHTHAITDTTGLQAALDAKLATNGDGSAVTNLNGTAIASGTVADARIAATIARDTEVTAITDPLDTRVDAVETELGNTVPIPTPAAKSFVMVDENDAVTSDLLVASVARRELTINTQTDSYTLVLSDGLGVYLRANKASAMDVTVPLNATVAFPVGTQIPIHAAGAGQVTIVATGGVTINTSETLKLRTQHSTASLIKVATNEWDLVGDLEEAP